MKNSRSILAFILILVLMLSLGVSAFAEGEPKFQATKDYITALKKMEGASCEPGETVSLGDKNYEIVNVSYEGKLSDLKFSFLAAVCEDGSDVILSLCLLRYDRSSRAEVLETVNDFNTNSNGVKVFADKSDNTINAEMYLLMEDGMSENIALTGTATMISVVDVLYEDFKNLSA